MMKYFKKYFDAGCAAILLVGLFLFALWAGAVALGVIR
jgi:hypothetical protein